MTETRQNPFPGLRSFEPNEEHLFFGREKQIDDLLTRLRLTRFLTVVGYSGSGKSSLVRSGLIPGLLSGYMVGTDASWRISVMRPGDDPLGNLASALFEPVAFDDDFDDLFATQDEEETEESDLEEAQDEDLKRAMMRSTLARSSQGLINAAGQLGLAPNQKLLVVVDQFEELFRFKRLAEGSKAGDQAQGFVKLLLSAAQQKAVPIFVVLTMRSDFLENCTELSGLAEAINDGQYLVPRMDREQRRAAITGPIAVSGTQVSARLVMRLLNDVGDNLDQLPIMQHALMRTWDYWQHSHDEDEPIDLRHYEAVGTMTEALSQHAEEAYMELSKQEERTCARMLFNALTEKGTDGRGIRRPTTILDVCAITGASQEEVIRVVNCFRSSGRTFLFPPEGTELNPSTILDISHESLMRVWTRLRDWVDEESKSAQLYQGLALAAQRYQEGSTGLFRDPELQVALRWKDQARPNSAWAIRYDPSFERAMIYLERSKEDKEREEARWSANQKQNLRRARIFVVILALFTLLATGLFIFSLFKAEEAKNEKAIAEEKRQEAVSAHHEAENARVTIEVQRNEAIRLRDEAQHSVREMEAARQTTEQSLSLAEASKAKAVLERNRAEMARAETLTALKEAEMAKDEANRTRAIAVEEQEKARAAERLARTSLERSRVLMVADFANELAKKVASLQQRDPQLAALTALRAYQLLASNGSQFMGLSTEPVLHDALRTAAHALNANIEPAQNLGDAVRVLRCLGRRLICGNDKGDLFLLNLEEKNPQPFLLAELSNGIRALATHPSLPLIAVGTVTGELQFLNINRPNSKDTPSNLKHTSQITALSFNADGSILAASDKSGLSFHYLTTGTELSFTGFPNPILSIAFHPQGSQFLVAGTQGAALVENIGDLASFAGPFLTRESVTAVAFSPNGHYLALGLARGEVLVWTTNQLLEPPTIHGGHISAINDLAFSPNNQVLASASADHTVRLWSILGESVSVVLNSHKTWVWSLAFNWDGHNIFSGGADERLQRWLVSGEDLAAGLLPFITRDMTPEEWQELVKESTTEDERRIIGDMLVFKSFKTLLPQNATPLSTVP